MQSPTRYPRGGTDFMDRGNWYCERDRSRTEKNTASQAYLRGFVLNVVLTALSNQRSLRIPFGRVRLCKGLSMNDVEAPTRQGLL